MVFLRAAQLLPTGALAFDFAAGGGFEFGLFVEAEVVDLEEDASDDGGGMAGILGDGRARGWEDEVVVVWENRSRRRVWPTKVDRWSKWNFASLKYEVSSILESTIRGRPCKRSRAEDR
jgi:hypothetical protein